MTELEKRRVLWAIRHCVEEQLGVKVDVEVEVEGPLTFMLAEDRKSITISGFTFSPALPQRRDDLLPWGEDRGED